VEGRSGGTGEPAPPRGRATTILRRVALVVTLAVYTIWDEALLSAPVIAAAGLWGAMPAFVAFVVLYGTAGYALSLLVVAAYARRLAGGQSRLERWVAKEAGVDRHRWARRLLQRGSGVGFAVASFALGPIVTTWVLYASGRVRAEVRKVALASTAIFAVTFVAPYCGLGQLLLGG
jgi:hypothetical protein